MRFGIIYLLMIALGCANKPDGNRSEVILSLDDHKRIADSCYQIDDYQSAIEHFNMLMVADSTNGEYIF